MACDRVGAGRVGRSSTKPRLVVVLAGLAKVFADWLSRARRGRGTSRTLPHAPRPGMPTPLPSAPYLLLVHGVASTGAWYDQVERALGAHFQVVRVHHHVFRWWFLGPIAAVIEPAVLLSAGGLAWWQLAWLVQVPLVATAAAAGAVGLALVGTSFRHGRTTHR